MRGVYGLFHIEMKRFFSRRNMIAWLIILILLLIHANIGVNKVKKIPETIQAFKQIQKNYFEKINNYNTYGFEGIMAIISPSHNMIFSWNSILPLFLTARIDSMVKLEISNDFKGKALIPVKWAGQLDITGIISWLITLMILWYGFTTFYTPKYTKFISSLFPPIKTFLTTIISRFILFIGAFIFSVLLVFFFIRLRGISFSSSDLTGL